MMDIEDAFKMLLDKLLDVEEESVRLELKLSKAERDNHRIEKERDELLQRVKYLEAENKRYLVETPSAAPPPRYQASDVVLSSDSKSGATLVAPPVSRDIIPF